MLHSVMIREVTLGNLGTDETRHQYIRHLLNELTRFHFEAFCRKLRGSFSCFFSATSHVVASTSTYRAWVRQGEIGQI